MGVSIYYTARRDRPLSDEERDEVTRIAADETRELLGRLDQNLPAWKDDGTVPAYVEDAGEICEGLSIYDPGAAADPKVILQGSSKVSHGDCGTEPMVVQLEYYATFALGRLRRVLPDADWDVHVDDMSLRWEEESGEYSYG
jgi:hypothetical protein